MMEQSAGEFGWQAEQVARQASRNLDVMLECGTVLTDGLQSLWQEWMRYTEEATQRNLRGYNDFLRCRNVTDLFAAQRDLVQDEMEVLVNRSTRMARLSAELAANAVQKMSAGAREATRSAERGS
jgi:hypothetical protein